MEDSSDVSDCESGCWTDSEVEDYAESEDYDSDDHEFFDHSFDIRKVKRVKKEVETNKVKHNLSSFKGREKQQPTQWNSNSESVFAKNRKMPKQNQPNDSNQFGKLCLPGSPSDYSTPLDLFELFFDDEFFETVVKFTNQKAQSKLDDKWKLTDETEMRAFIGLLIAAGIQKANYTADDYLWNDRKGGLEFRATMSRNRFRQLRRFIRFDDMTTRNIRRKKFGKLAPIKDLWEKFEAKLSKFYKPGPHLCIDEQLVGFRGRCPFRIYNKSKPDRYGFLIYWIVDAITAYPLHGIPYLGKNNTHSEQSNTKSPQNSKQKTNTVSAISKIKPCRKNAKVTKAKAKSNKLKTIQMKPSTRTKKAQASSTNRITRGANSGTKSSERINKTKLPANTISSETQIKPQRQGAKVTKTKSQNGGLAKNMVLKLVEPYFKSRRNVTFDNFFTNLETAEELWKQEITCLGTVRANKSWVPEYFLLKRKKGSVLHGFRKNATLLSFQSKDNKAVVVLSTMHLGSPRSTASGLPEMIDDYNNYKGGVDTMDQQVHNYSCKRRSNRWPMAYFCNIIDVGNCAIYVINELLRSSWEEKSRLKRGNFLDYLATQLMFPYVLRRQNQNGLQNSTQKDISAYIEKCNKLFGITEKQVEDRTNENQMQSISICLEKLRINQADKSYKRCVHCLKGSFASSMNQLKCSQCGRPCCKIRHAIELLICTGCAPGARK